MYVKGDLVEGVASNFIIPMHGLTAPEEPVRTADLSTKSKKQHPKYPKRYSD
jgi:hypothetical protein